MRRDYYQRKYDEALSAEEDEREQRAISDGKQEPRSGVGDPEDRENGPEGTVGPKAEPEGE